MTTLSIYVEKWYIVGAVCVDNVPHVIELPNKEDRIWLYFYEDVANDLVYYGKVNKRNAQNKENHYIHDVFSRIVESDATFKKFGRNYPMSEIFKYSGIFDDLKAAFAKFSNEQQISTYISFSQDISYDAQNIFKEELTKNDFVVKQFAGKLDFLALEWVKKKKSLNINKDKFALVLRSTNENLHMSLFKTDGTMFLEKDKDVLDGYGSDVRRHAVIEDVVTQGNSTFHFLTRDEDFKHEKLRMEEFVEEWILKLDHGRPGIPVKITDVYFSLAPNNKFTANLKRNSIDERTKAIIRVIVDYIKTFIKTKSNIHEYDLDAVVLLGNSFANSQYLTELDSWLQIGSDKIFRIAESQLPDVVGVYSQIDPGYFSKEENIFASQAEMERERQEKFEEEERERQYAETLAREARQSDAAKALAEKKYKDAMDQAYEADSKHDFSSMREFLSIALDAKPNDETASKLLKQLDDREIKEGIKNEQYRVAINQADQAMESGDYDSAFAFYTQALTIDPSSSHAKAKLAEVKKIKSDKEKAAESVTKAEVFEGQGLMEKALTELRKAELLDPDNADVKSKISSIENSIKEIADKISNLETTIKESLKNNDFDSAIFACEELITIDVNNKSKWEKKVKSLQAEKESYLEKLAVIQDCRKKVQEAAFNDNWDEVQKNCRRALSYDLTDDFFQRYLEKAVKELGKKAIDKTVQTIGAGVDKVKDTVGGIIGKGRKVEPKKDEPDDWDFGSSKPSTSSSKPKEAGTSPKKAGTDDWDFGSSKPSTNSSKPKEAGTSPKKNGTDDWNFSSSKPSSSSKPKGTSTAPKKDDFDF